MKLYVLLEHLQAISAHYGNDMDVKIVFDKEGAEDHEEVLSVGYDENHREVVLCK